MTRLTQEQRAADKAARQENAKASGISKRNAAKDLMAKINTEISTMQINDWGDAGSLAHVEEKLHQIAAFLGLVTERVEA